jgi:hypothetical protein
VSPTALEPLHRCRYAPHLTRFTGVPEHGIGSATPTLLFNILPNHMVKRNYINSSSICFAFLQLNISWLNLIVFVLQCYAEVEGRPFQVLDALDVFNKST